MADVEVQSRSLKDIVAEEYVRCADDPVYFLKKHCIIQHPIRGKIPFELYDFQEKTVEELLTNRYSIILKARQLGISTLTAGLSLHMMLFGDDKNILVIATTQKIAKNLVTKVRVMHEGLPSYLKGRLVEDNRLGLRFANGSQIQAASSSGDASRSEALSLLILDEAAFIDRIEDIWTAAQQTLATGGDVVILSTPNGVGNFFHKQWVAALEGSSDFNPIRLHWSVHPERDQAWRDEQEKVLGSKTKAAQECDCDFVTSGNTVIEGEIIKWYEDNHVKDPIEKRGFDGNLWIWEPVDYSKNYIVAADVARGDGSDYSAFHVIEIESMAQVAEYKGLIDTKDYGNMLINVATEYNDALLVIENATVGWASIQPAIDRGYKNLYYSAKDLVVVDVNLQLNKGYDLKSKDKMVPGFTMSPKIRPLVISKMQSYFNAKDPIIRSQRTIDELFVFIWKGSKPEASGGYNDDLVMAFSMAMWVRDTALVLRREGIELQKKALAGFGKGASFVTTGAEQFRYGQHPWKMSVGNNEEEDLTWLL